MTCVFCYRALFNVMLCQVPLEYEIRLEGMWYQDQHYNSFHSFYIIASLKIIEDLKVILIYSYGIAHPQSDQ